MTPQCLTLQHLLAYKVGDRPTSERLRCSYFLRTKRARSGLRARAERDGSRDAAPQIDVAQMAEALSHVLHARSGGPDYNVVKLGLSMAGTLARPISYCHVRTAYRSFLSVF